MAANFTIAIELNNQNHSILTPLKTPNYKEVNSGVTTQNNDTISFNISIQKTRVDSLSIKISQGSTVLLQQALSATHHAVGKHVWSWDGFSSSGVFDTKQLKASSITIEVTAQSGSDIKKSAIELDCTHDSGDWVDVSLNKTANRIEVEIRANIVDGGQEGVGELPPNDVQQTPAFTNLPLTDTRRARHIRVKSFNDLQTLLLSAISLRWSRSVTYSGTNYQVVVNAINATTKAMDDIDIKYNTNGTWLRSSNPGKVTGIISFFANVVPEKIAYNIGWIRYSNGWSFDRVNEADRDFGETGAHELGHEVLQTYGGDSYSYGHKGTSTVTSQKTLPIAEGGITYPATGNIDLMKYYNGPRPANFYTRVFASEQDVKSLLWIARLKFSQKGLDSTEYDDY